MTNKTKAWIIALGSIAAIAAFIIGCVHYPPLVLVAIFLFFALFWGWLTYKAFVPAIEDLLNARDKRKKK